MGEPFDVKELMNAKEYGPFVAIVVGTGAILGVYTQIRTLLREVNRRYRDLDERTRAVTFWDSWVKAQTAVSTGERLEQIREIARTQLDSLAANLPDTTAASIGALRRFFLFYLPPARRFWLSRAPYYVCALLSAYLVWILVTDIAANRYSLVSFILPAAMIMITSALWMVASGFEKRAAVKGDVA